MAKTDEGAVTLTQDQLKDVIAAGVAAGLAATAGSRRLQGAEVYAKVQKIKNHEGEYAKAPKPTTPPVGYAIVADQYGANPKIVEVHNILGVGLTAQPFEGGFKNRTQPVPTGQLAGALVRGDMQLLAFTPYAAGVVINAMGAAVDQAASLPRVSNGPTAPTIATAKRMTEKNGTWFEPFYLSSLGTKAA